MIVAPGATSVSVDVFFADDSGFALTGKVAADFPACKWSSGTNTADTTITLTDLAAITTAHPNDNTAGGVKEREGGWYRLDLPNNMLTSAGRKTLTFAETTNKRILGPFVDCQYTQVDLRQTLGSTSVGTAGYVGVDWGQVANKTTTNALTGTTIAATQQVDVNTIKTQAVTCAAGVTVGAFVGNATAALAVNASGRIDVGLWLGVAPLALSSQQVQAIVPNTQKVDVETIKTNPVVNGGTVTFPTNATLASTTNITAAAGCAVSSLGANVITAAATATDFGTEIATAIWTDTTAGDFTVGLSIGKSIMNGVSLGTGLTINAYTGNTVQTGDSFARIGATGSGLTSLAPSATALSTVQWTNTRAGYLDNLSAGAVALASGVVVTTNNDKAGYALTAAYDFAKGTVAVTESYNADGAAPTPVQALLLTMQMLTEMSIAGTTMTIKKLDGSSTAATLTLDSGTAPTSITRAT